MVSKVLLRIVLAVLLAGALISTIGIHDVMAVDWWPMFRHDPSHSGHSTSKAPHTNNVQWTFTTGGVVDSSPIVVDDKVYFVSNDDTLFCTGAETGTLIWSYTSIHGVTSSPTYAEGNIFVGLGNGFLVKLDADTGAPQPIFMASDRIASAPAVVDGMVYFGSDDFSVYCVRASDGYEEWSFQTWNHVNSSPAVAGGRVYVGSGDGAIYCLNARSGVEIWSDSTSGYFHSSPTVFDGKVYIGSYNGRLYCRDAYTGEEIWRVTIGSAINSSPAVADGRVYFGAYNNRVYCVDAQTGGAIWDHLVVEDPYSSPAVAGGMVFVGSTDNKLYCLNALTGEEIWTYTTGGNVLSSPAIANGRVYVGSDDGKLYAFGPDDWSMFHHDGEHSGYSKSVAPNSSGWDWNYLTGDDVYSSPAVTGDRLYVGSHDDNIYCLDAGAGDGDLIWSYTTGDDVSSSPAVDDGKVFVGSNDNKIYCLDAEGNQDTTTDTLWTYDTNNSVTSSPCVANGRVYVGSADKLYCLNAETGSVIWIYDTFSFFTSSPAVFDGKVYVGAFDHYVYCLPENDPNGNGFITPSEVIWSYETGGVVESSPAVAGGKVFVGSDDEKVYCLDATSGSLIWTYTTGGNVTSSPAVAYGNVYVGSLDNVVYCLPQVDPNPDGVIEPSEVIWMTSTLGAAGVESSPAVADGKVYVGSNGYWGVHCLDAATGAIVWRHPVSNQYVRSSPAVAGGRVFVGTDLNRIFAYSALQTLTLTVVAGIGGTTLPTPGAHSYDEWTVAGVKATPDPGYLFDHWELDGVAVGSADSISVLMDSDYQLEAVFVVAYTLTITTADGGTTDPPPGAYLVAQDSTVSVLAMPEACDSFAHWELDGIPIGSANPTTVVMDMDHTLNAVFQPITDCWAMFHRDQYRTGYTDSRGPNTSYVVWSEPLGGIIHYSPAYVGGKVYVGTTASSGDNFFCYDASTGLQLWKTQLSGGSPTSPAVVDGMVYVRAGYEVYCLNADTGSNIWTYPADTNSNALVVVAYGRLCVDLRNGRCFCGFVSGRRLRQRIYWNSRRPVLLPGRFYG
jgi:outer membrane protein assembly factor BamB